MKSKEVKRMTKDKRKGKQWVGEHKAEQAKRDERAKKKAEA